MQAMMVGLLLIVLPLAGAWINGNSLARYTEFPPVTQYTRHAPFSWFVFLVMGLLVLLVIAPFDVRVLLTRLQQGKKLSELNKHPMPWWGWGGLALTMGVWFIAWTRLEVFAPFQLFTFSPLWLGYILFANALTYRRSGHSLLTDNPLYLLKLFVASAVFWWFFEYLNRFVQNWYYVGLDGISPLKYFLFATLPFATVIPAVISTHDLLATYPAAGAGLENFVRINVRFPRTIAVVALMVSAAGLLSIAIVPNLLYPVLWLAPLFIITSLQVLFGGKTLFAPVRHGHWRRIYLAACAALICGFFWEMWNYQSVAKWIYTVPYVTRFKLFEMPVLGFAGYIPFGLECVVIADWIKRG